jgi:hypothetical protein
MKRPAHPLLLPDVAAFSRALREALVQRHSTRPAPPGHVELLNLVARAAGHRNFQALKVAAPAVTPAPEQTASRAKAADPAPQALSDNARKALALFDGEGRMRRWPVKFSVQALCMWALWTHFQAKRPYTEREVNAVLKGLNAFNDHVTLRRELINHRLLARKSDCSEYWKLPARPEADARAFLAAYRASTQAG